MSALSVERMDGLDPRCSQLRLALLRLLGDHAWHPWWQVFQVGAVFVDSRIAGRRYIRHLDDKRQRYGRGRSGLDLYQADPERADRLGKAIVVRMFLRRLGAERRGPHGASEYRLPPPETEQGKGGRR